MYHPYCKLSVRLWPKVCFKTALIEPIATTGRFRPSVSPRQDQAVPPVRLVGVLEHLLQPPGTQRGACPIRRVEYYLDSCGFSATWQQSFISEGRWGGGRARSTWTLHADTFMSACSCWPSYTSGCSDGCSFTLVNRGPDQVVSTQCWGNRVVMHWWAPLRDVWLPLVVPNSRPNIPSVAQFAFTLILLISNLTWTSAIHPWQIVEWSRYINRSYLRGGTGCQVLWLRGGAFILTLKTFKTTCEGAGWTGLMMVNMQVCETC